MNGAAATELTAQDRLLIRDLRNQSQRLVWAYLALAVVAAPVIWYTDPAAGPGHIAQFLCGALAGFAIEKLVTGRIRRIAWNLYVEKNCKYSGD